ncbi:hypothetical protein B0H14DRAFT_3507979 [Mycena olivaceomarginata]|nr:hypothetical protein B0H14DRAFT_3507979 [Mycena olivaceomarginata]
MVQHGCSVHTAAASAPPSTTPPASAPSPSSPDGSDRPQPPLPPAAKAQELIRGNTTASSSATARTADMRSQGSANTNKKLRKDGAKGKKGGDAKGKGNHREYNDFF